MTKRTFTIRYEKPKTLEEALDRRDALGSEIEQIQVQLGMRPNDNEWRNKAKIAMLCKSEELRRIKTFIRANSSQKNHFAELRADLYEALDCLLDAYHLIDTVEAYRFTPQLQGDRIEALLKKHGYLVNDDEDRTTDSENDSIATQGSNSG